MSAMAPIYLNNAASSWPKAPGVAEAVRRAVEAMPAEPGRGSGHDTDPRDECRSLLAGLMGIPWPERIALTQGATLALNLAILGCARLGVRHAVTTATEHNSVLRPLRHLERQGILRLSVVGLTGDGQVDLEQFVKALAGGVDLVVVNHASNVTGRVNDAATLFRLAREAGALTLLDASQTLGVLPVRPLEIGAQMVAFTGHKGLCGPEGTGGLYVSPEVDLPPVLSGGTGVRSDLPLQPDEMPMRLEAGTPNSPGLAGLAAALRWAASDGRLEGQRRRDLGSLLRRSLSQIRRVHVFDAGCPEEAGTGVVSFAIAGWPPDEAALVLEECFGIRCRAGLHCAPEIHRWIGSAPYGTIRFSVSGANTESDVEAAVSAVRAMAAARAEQGEAAA